MAIGDIDTFVIVMLENRSFDHVCGYLSLPDAAPPMDVEGLRADQAWLDQWRNDDLDGTPVPIHRLEPDEQNFIDPPHEDVNIATQINTPTHGGAQPMLGGFVKSYANAIPRPENRSAVMGYYTKEAVPVFDFFARNYAICDHWFSSLPAGTQSNRLMAMSGQSDIIHNVGPVTFPDQQLAYDWLTKNVGANGWCSYQYGGVPFFSLMHRWIDAIASGRKAADGRGLFRQYEHFADQWQGNDPLPNVIFIEPKYSDDPSVTKFRPNDDHCPTGISHGQKFLADIYNTVIGNSDRWKKTALIVTYDEHGGFFDHVPPLDVPVTAGGETFGTTGIRVPTFIVSPYVKPGVVYKDQADATSILALLADRFTPDVAYSQVVADRQQSFKPLRVIFDNAPVTDAPKPIPQAAIDALIYTDPEFAMFGPPQSNTNALAFRGAIQRLAQLDPTYLIDSTYQAMV